MVKLSKEDIFSGPTNKKVPCACASLAPKSLLDLLIQVAEKSKSGTCYFNIRMER